MTVQLPDAPPTADTTPLSSALRRALAGAREDRLFFDLAGIEERYQALIGELPGVQVRFALKACPVDGVLDRLASLGAGFDAASPAEIARALRTGASPRLIHYGNTIKSESDIAMAHRLGIRFFATDSLEDVASVAAHAPGARVYCRLATSGVGSLWGLGGKFGCPPAEAVRILRAVRDQGLVASGLSVHVGSQQMRPEAWQEAADDMIDVIRTLGGHGIHLDHVNLGGGLPAAGYADRGGRALEVQLDKIYAVILETVQRIREASATPLEFILEPGRHLVADHGAIRAHVVRLSSRRHAGRQVHWLYLSCGKFNGLYEMDQVQYRLVFPGHIGGETVRAVVAGPTCDSDDAFGSGDDELVAVPSAVASGDPVWILSSGAYAVSYMTRGFNGIPPLPHACVEGPDGEVP